MDFVKPNEIIDNSPEISTYKEQCDLLNMISIPTFGIYSEDYAFLEQLLILKKNSIPNTLPSSVKDQIDYLKKNYPDLKPEFFHITLSSSILFSISPEKLNPLSYTALNYISHPYIFYNCQLNKEHKSDIYCAAYIDELEIDTIKEEKGNTHLRLNPKCNIDDGQLKREVYMHLSGDGYPSLSPNNCQLLINLNSQIINFYIITCGTYGGKIVKCFIGNYVIIPNSHNSILFNDINKSLLVQKNKEKLIEDLIVFRNKYNDMFIYILSYYLKDYIIKAKSIEEVKKYSIKAFSIIFDIFDNFKEENKKIIENISNYYYNNIINFITDLYPYGKNISNNFGFEILENSLKNGYIVELILKYIKFNTSRINNIILNILYFICDNEDILFYFQNNSNLKFRDSIFPNLKKFCCDKLIIDLDKLEESRNFYNEIVRNPKNNPDLEILINICQSIKNKGNINIYDLSDIMRNYLFYIVWEKKGKVLGVHNDFGRISFMRINEIDNKYFCSDEERLNCCELLIQHLINVDEKKY